MSLLHNDKAIHWAEALGLSAAVHAGAAFLLFNFSVDLDRLIPDAPPERGTPDHLPCAGHRRTGQCNQPSRWG